MRAVMVMYDSLRLDMLPSYGGKEVELPNFRRLAERTVQFDNSYVCSLPCMPARRELHTCLLYTSKKNVSMSSFR